MRNLANLSNNCFCPNSLKKIVALMSGLFPSKLITLPNPKRSCSTSIPTCKWLVSDGSNPGEGTCALGNMDVVRTGLGLGLVNASFCCQAIRSEENASSDTAAVRTLKSISKYDGCSSSKKATGFTVIERPPAIAASSIG